jgi:hypothetical protein
MHDVPLHDMRIECVLPAHRRAVESDLRRRIELPLVAEKENPMLRFRTLSLAFIIGCSGAPTTDLDGGGGNDATADTTNNPDAGTDSGGCVKTTPGGGSSCGAGECYCASASGCYASATAAACCGDSVTCASSGGSPDAGGCTFQHPLVDGGARFCAPGNCYCKWSTGESCYSAATAATCCAGDSFTCY